MHRASIHNYHTCTQLPYTTITLAQGYYTQPPHMHAATVHTHHTCTCYCIHLQTPCTIKVTPIYTQCRYHTHEPYTPIPTLYMYHTSRHTLTYVCVCHRCLHLHLPLDLPTQAWMYKHTQVHTCCRHLSDRHTHICTYIDIYPIHTQHQTCSPHHHMHHSLCHMYISTILIWPYLPPNTHTLRYPHSFSHTRSHTVRSALLLLRQPYRHRQASR